MHEKQNSKRRKKSKTTFPKKSLLQFFVLHIFKSYKNFNKKIGYKKKHKPPLIWPLMVRQVWFGVIWLRVIWSRVIWWRVIRSWVIRSQVIWSLVIWSQVIRSRFIWSWVIWWRVIRSRVILVRVIWLRIIWSFDDSQFSRRVIWSRIKKSSRFELNFKFSS
jgi:hypothetical protein